MICSAVFIACSDDPKAPREPAAHKIDRAPDRAEKPADDPDRDAPRVPGTDAKKPTAGQKLDDATNRTGEKIEAAGDKTADGIERFGEKIDAAAKKTGEKLDAAAKKTGEKLREDDQS
jgi:hypothetical protein